MLLESQVPNSKEHSSAIIAGGLPPADLPWIGARPALVIQAQALAREQRAHHPDAALKTQNLLGLADTILGTQPGRLVPDPVVPIHTGMFGPHGCWAQPGGPLIVADTGNHGVPIWRDLPRDDATAPDYVLSHAGFTSGARSRGGTSSARSSFVPLALEA